MQNNQKDYIKFALSLMIVFIFRILPFRPPNVEPIMAVGMPFSRAYGAVYGFLFSFLSILSFDFLTNQLGVWTIVTSVTYGVVGFLATWYLRNKENSPLSYASFAVFGTLFFDAVTGLSIGPLFFHQSFISALVGQVPFTLWHLLGNVSFALLFSPAFYRFIIKNEKLETSFIINLFFPKKAL